MNSDIQDRLLVAVAALLRPLARILLRAGISYHQFDEAAKLAFVRESLGRADRAGKRTNVSRIAVRTGLSRKEVARLRDLIESSVNGVTDSSARPYHASQAARVLQIWHTDRNYLDSAGRPKELSFDSGGQTFANLVKHVGGDVPAGAVRAELIAAEAVEETPEGQLRAIKRHFIPGDLGEDLLVGFGHIVTPLMSALAHNSVAPKEDAYLQRVAYSNSMPASAFPKFREVAAEHAGEFLRAVDDWISANESPGLTDEPQAVPNVGVGVFYFEKSDLSQK